MRGKAGILVLLVALAGCDTILAGDLDAGASGQDVADNGPVDNWPADGTVDNWPADGTVDKGPTDGPGDGPGSSNSGAICNQTTPCPSASEGCFVLNPASQNGMCLGMCQNLGGTCKVPDPSTQFSSCVIQKPTPTIQMYCAWLCEAQGKTYQCPANTNYACMALDHQNPAIKYCVPW